MDVVKVLDVLHLECVAEGLSVSTESLVQLLFSDVGGIGGDNIEQAQFHSLCRCLGPVQGDLLLGILGCQLGFKVLLPGWSSNEPNNWTIV